MASETRNRMVVGALTLLAQRGMQATSFAEVIEATGTPRGSIYHHFPNGKEQLVGEAIELAGARAMGRLTTQTGAPAAQIVELFIQGWRSLLVATGCTTGCAVLAVTVSSDSMALLDQAASVFRTWSGTLSSLLAAGGMEVAESRPFANLLIAACEGAVVLSRAERDLAPFDDVADMLRGIVNRGNAVDS